MRTPKGRKLLIMEQMIARFHSIYKWNLYRFNGFYKRKIQYSYIQFHKRDCVPAALWRRVWHFVLCTRFSEELPMLTLPRTIEQSLLDAGLSQTEILVLQHLVAEDMVTLRQLATKTGKSTGVLDQAMKRLLRRNIVTRKSVNDSPRYLLTSLESVVGWMREDMRLKKTVLERRHQDFLSFLSTLERNRTRPDLSHFEGTEGMALAYKKLLTLGAKELLSFLPILFKEEEHPLSAFYSSHARERRKRGIVLRVVAYDTPLGRRYKSRDPFEHRQTTLIPEDRFPIPFERVIAGEVVACFDLQEQRACFLQYPKLAKAERTLFCSLVKQGITTTSISSATIMPEPKSMFARGFVEQIRAKFSHQN